MPPMEELSATCDRSVAIPPFKAATAEHTHLGARARETVWTNGGYSSLFHWHHLERSREAISRLWMAECQPYDSELRYFLPLGASVAQQKEFGQMRNKTKFKKRTTTHAHKHKHTNTENPKSKHKANASANHKANSKQTQTYKHENPHTHTHAKQT